MCARTRARMCAEGFSLWGICARILESLSSHLEHKWWKRMGKNGC